ncbi:MAG: hypothetical protein WAM70_16530 [Pyrinomonadaceae bacterium]
MIDALQNARYGLVNAQLFLKAKTKLTSEEANVLEEMATFTYDCEIIGRDGMGRGAVIDVCIDNVLAYVKENRDRAARLFETILPMMRGQHNKPLGDSNCGTLCQVGS